MSNLLTYPLEDNFETTLSQSWNGATGTVYVNDTPSFTFPSTTTTYIVVNPGKTNMQVAKVNAYDTTAKTFTVSSISVKSGAGTSYTQQSHASGSVVRISDNYQFREDIATAIATKVNTDGDSLIANNNKLEFGGTSAYIYSTDSGTNLKFKDASNSVTTLTQLTAGAGTDHKVLATASDTTAGYLSNKTNARNGLSKSTGSPAGDETLILDIDLTDTTVFVQTSSGSADSGLSPILGGDGRLANGFMALGYFGDGSDGDVTITGGTTTLTRDTYYNNLQIDGSGILNPNGYRFFVAGTMTGTGKVQRNGNAGSAGSGQNAGAGATALNTGSLAADIAAGAGGAGGTNTGSGSGGVAGTAANPTYLATNGSTGGAGGASGTPGAGGVGGTSTRGPRYNEILTLAQLFGYLAYPASYSTFNFTPYKGSASAGGGGGGSAAGGTGGANLGGGGGGGGGNGGTIVAHVNTVNRTGTWESIGGVGGAGGAAASTGSATSGGGGGGGGNGGSLTIIYHILTSVGTITLTGGAGGAGGAGAGGGGTGVTGTNGTTTTSIQIAV